MQSPKPFKGKDGKYHFIYRTHNLVNGKEYTGKHSTENLNDGYYGSGLGLSHAIAKYGIENFAVEFLSFHNTSIEAFKKEHKLITEEYVKRDDTYNQKEGGHGGWDHIDTSKSLVVKDKTEKCFRVPLNDPRYLLGELVSINTGWMNYKDKDNNNVWAKTTDPRVLSNELIPFSSGTITVKDSKGNTQSVSVNDPRYLSGELIPESKDMIPVRDINGTTFRVYKDDPRYLSGELVHVTKGRSTYRNPCTGETMSCFKNDPRVLSGELIGITKGISVKHKPFKIVMCPHCKKEGKENAMKRWHFDNCKLKK